jgi:hypothetical protein
VREDLFGGEAHSRSLGYARDDKFEGGGPLWHGGGGWTESSYYINPPRFHNRRNLCVRDDQMTAKKTSNRLDNDIADDAVKLLGAKSRREAVDFALQEIVALKRFKKLIRKRAGKLSFDGYKE